MPIAILALLFVFLEIAGFVAVADAIGLLGVFALVILGLFGGVLVIRTIGFASVQRMQERAEQGETVGQELGGLVLGFVGGILLILPGFLTDLIGLALLVKPIQTLVWPRYGRQMASRMPDIRQTGTWRSPGRPDGSQPPPEPSSVVIDADLDASSPSEASGSTRRPGGDNPWGT